MPLSLSDLEHSNHVTASRHRKAPIDGDSRVATSGIGGGCTGEPWSRRVVHPGRGVPTLGAPPWPYACGQQPSGLHREVTEVTSAGRSRDRLG